MDSNNHKKGQHLNLRHVAQNFMDGVQRHADMLAFNLASRESVQEGAYKQRSLAPRIMPAGNRHQNFEQMQAYARDLLVRQVINDSLGLCSSALNNCHFFFALIRETNASDLVDKEAQKKAEKLHKQFLKLSLEDKFEFLEREYDVVSSYTKTILSLVIALRALVENGGILKAEFLDTVPRQIELSIKRLKVDQKMDTTAKATGKMIDEVKVFREGEAIVFSDVEVQRILVTVASFADSLFKSVAGYARKVKGEL
jgi:hypothetical protein